MAFFEDNLPYFPFGSRNLRRGSVGTDVKVLQALFNRYRILGTITVDGIVGPQTEGAVQRLQERFGLVIDGIVGPETLFVLGQGDGRHTPYGGPPFGSRTLSRGMSGGDVMVLQNRLNNHHIISQNLNRPADGVFDEATEQAVGVFQGIVGGQIDPGLGNGVVGPETFDAFWAFTSWGGRNLQSLPTDPTVGDRGIDMLFLTSLLFPQINYVIRYMDRPFGAPTERLFFSEAVSIFQARNGLPETGVADPATYLALAKTNVGWPPVLIGPIPGGILPEPF